MCGVHVCRRARMLTAPACTRISAARRWRGRHREGQHGRGVKLPHIKQEAKAEVGARWEDHVFLQCLLELVLKPGRQLDSLQRSTWVGNILKGARESALLQKWHR
jgi:hypothetical protein